MDEGETQFGFRPSNAVVAPAEMESGDQITVLDQRQDKQMFDIGAAWGSNIEIGVAG
jgi:hypothetical protein